MNAPPPPKDIRNEARARRRKELYHSDPLWRLTKLKDCKERRLRAKLGQGAAARRIAQTGG